MKAQIDAAKSATLQRQLEHVAGAFTMRFGRAPRFAAAAPGRVNLIGEHTDYNDGFVLPMAIERRVVVAADLAPIKQSTLWCVDVDETVAVDLTLPLSPIRGSAANHLLGVAKQFADREIYLPNIDLAVSGTVPIGAGLSSSAALEVAFATLLEEITGERLDPLDKAMLCRAAEHEFPRTPCGIMDMYTAIFARPGSVLLIDCRSNASQHVPLPLPRDVTVLIVDTLVRHDLAAGEYAERQMTCRSAADGLGLPALRDATADMLERADLTLQQRKRALHVISENARTVLAAEALARSDVRALGDLMFASHDSLRDLFEVSCAELDVIVDAARQFRKANGSVYGARMTGGGFGGCAVALCRTETLAQVMHHLQQAFEQSFGRSCTMFTTHAAGGAQVLRI